MDYITYFVSKGEEKTYHNKNKNKNKKKKENETQDNHLKNGNATTTYK
jgi:hypothetical protein